MLKDLNIVQENRLEPVWNRFFRSSIYLEIRETGTAYYDHKAEPGLKRFSRTGFSLGLVPVFPSSKDWTSKLYFHLSLLFSTYANSDECYCSSRFFF